MMRALLIFIRCLFQIEAPFCRRWGHAYVRGFGAGNEYRAVWVCEDPECGWAGNERSASVVLDGKFRD